MDAARTGLTFVCSACGLRTDATECRACGGPLVDLRRPETRDALYRRKPGEFTFGERARLFVVFSSLPSFVGLAGLCALTVGAPLAGAGLLMAATAGTVGIGMWAFTQKTTPALLKTTRPGPLPETTRSEDVVRVEGIVRAKQTMTSPVFGTACVAARVAGAVDTVVLDDAVLTGFDVELDDGERVEIPEGAATLVLPVAPPRPRAPSAALSSLLEERGARPEDPRSLAEAVLAEGDRVVVEGLVEERPAEPDGYRTTTMRRAIVEGPGVVRIIRRG